MEKDNLDNNFVNNYANNDRSEDSLIHPVLFDFIGNVTGKRIIDYGCGEGELALKIAQLGATQVLGIDVSEGMIKSAKKNCVHENLKFEYITGNTIPAKDSSIDIIVSNLVFVMIPTIEGLREVIEESYRVLREKGKLVFTITNPSFLDKDFVYYRNIFSDRFKYNHVGQQLQFVLKTADGVEITDKTFIDYHYRWEDYINIISKSGLNITRVKELIIPDNDYPPFAVFSVVK